MIINSTDIINPEKSRIGRLVNVTNVGLKCDSFEIVIIINSPPEFLISNNLLLVRSHVQYELELDQ